MTTSHPDYIRFYNSLWLVANDIIIGIALGSYIIENATQVAYNIDSYLNVSILPQLHESVTDANSKLGIHNRWFDEYDKLAHGLAGRIETQQ